MSTRYTCLVALLLSGCCTPEYLHTVHVFGNVDVDRDERLAKKAEELGWDADYSKIRVVGSALPEGIGLSGDGQQIAIAAGFESRYQVLGSIASTFPAAFYASYFWYYPMHDKEGSFRPAWCAWQAPLRAVTLGLWSLFVPLNYACVPHESPDGHIHERELRRMAAAMGGNLVIVASTDGTTLRRSGAGVGNYLDATKVQAYVLVDHQPTTRSGTDSAVAANSLQPGRGVIPR